MNRWIAVSIALASLSATLSGCVVAPARPVYYAPHPVYVAPRPVYVAPRPVYVAPRPVVVY